VEPASGVAVRVTEVFGSKFAEHMVPQLMPAGLLVIVPVPVPDLLMLSMYFDLTKYAIHALSLLAVMVHMGLLPQLSQSPSQILKAEIESGVACNVIEEPSLNMP